LIAAGRALLPAVGCAGLSVRALAERAGVASGMFHYHFGSKEQFLRTLLAGMYEEMFASLSQQVAQAADPVERLVGALRLLARFARAHRQLLARLWSDAMAGNPAAQDFFKHNMPRHMGLLMAQVAQAQADGTLRELPPLTTLSFVMGALPLPMIFVAGLVDAGTLPRGGKALFAEQVMSDAAIEARIGLVLDALRAPPPAAKTRRRR
jgi:AcrR family transcriptional regulator